MLVVSNTNAQELNYVSLSKNTYWKIDKTLATKDSLQFTSIKPCRQMNVPDTSLPSTIQLLDDNKMTFKPLLGLTGGYSDDMNYSAIGGFNIDGDLGTKLTYNANFIYSYVKPVDFIESNVTSIGVLPGMGYTDTTKSTFQSWNWGGHISYSPNNIFNFQLGKGKQFFGDGYRSLLLSDNSSNYPFFKIETKVWKIKYVNLFTSFNDIQNSNGIQKQFRRKYSTTHYLSWNINKSLNISLFETIIWQAKDSLLNRGYDINYLNPVIFYRPIEYAQGSADNALMGLNAKVKVTDKSQFYGQIVLDEFLLKNVKADIIHIVKPNDTTISYGWWANKYGFQLGYKHYDLLKEGLDVATEINIVRPYTYSHSTTLQNYGHYNQPLAHPWGANFKEWVNIIRYEKSKFLIQNKLIIGMFGVDTSSVNYGKDIYQSYGNRAANYEVAIGDGQKNKLIHNHISFSYLLMENIDLNLKAGYVYRRLKNNLQNQETHYLYIGFVTSLPNFYNDY